jgi:phage tail protein X
VSQDPNLIRQDIADRQARMGDTVEALAYKANVPARARDAVNDRVDALKSKVSGAVASVTGAVSDARGAISTAAAGVPPPSESLDALRSVAADNPLGLVIGSVAAGFLIGLCLPVSDLERERVGRLGERVTEQAKTAATEAIEQGKVTLSQAIGDAISGSAT